MTITEWIEAAEKRWEETRETHEIEIPETSADLPAVLRLLRAFGAVVEDARLHCHTGPGQDDTCELCQALEAADAAVREACQ